LNYFDAHDPYLPPIEIARLYGLKRPYGHENAYIFKNLPPEALKELNLAYEATIQYMDQQIGNLIENLTSQNILDDTLVIITADHGEFFGEHGMLNHANGLYMELIHVPMLLIHSQKVPKGQILDTPVSLRNIPATILDFIGISNQAIFPGHNLARFWQEDTVTEEVPYSHTTIEDSKTSIYHNWLESIVYQDLHYIRPEQQDEELYDIKNDSGELHNLAADPDYKETLLQYQAYLKDIHSSP
jgi:arylsulfatase A-like enzyme